MQKIYDDTNVLSKKKGNGLLRREVWVDDAGRVVRYNLAYINQNEFRVDNGRMLGYDNAHGHHHRHYLGKVDPIEFTSFEDIEDRFEKDFMEIRSKK
jgi:hypothetical protein